MSLANFDSYQLALRFHELAASLKVPRYLRDQLLRASSSVALNIAEGSGKLTLKDQQRFYAIALGSLRESQAVLDLAKFKGSEAAQLADRLGGCLWRLCHPR